MDLNESRMSLLPAPLEDIQFYSDNNKDILKIPNGKEIQDELSLLEKLSKDSFHYLNDYTNFFFIKNENLIKQINIYWGKMVDKYCQFNINEKPSQNQKKYESETDFIIDTERNITLMKRINKIYAQIFDSIKQNLEVLT